MGDSVLPFREKNAAVRRYALLAGRAGSRVSGTAQTAEQAVLACGMMWTPPDTREVVLSLPHFVFMICKEVNIGTMLTIDGTGGNDRLSNSFRYGNEDRYRHPHRPRADVTGGMAHRAAGNTASPTAHVFHFG